MENSSQNKKVRPDFLAPRCQKVRPYLFVLCLGLAVPLYGQDIATPVPPTELPIDLALISEDIYINQPIPVKEEPRKYQYAKQHAEVGLDFSTVLQEFISTHHLTDLLTKSRTRLKRPKLELTDLVIYYSIYELEDPRIFRAMMTAMEAGVSIVIVTDGDNALPFKPVTQAEQAKWTHKQQAFYLERYDKNRDGIVDLEDKAESDYRTRLMKTFIAQTQTKFRAWLRENKRKNRFLQQDLRIVMSPHKYVPPEGVTYLPLHHTKLLMVAARLSAKKTIPLEALFGTSNATFSDTRGDMKPEMIDRLAAGEFLTHDIVDADFEPESQGNINVMVKIASQEILTFLLEQDILDAIRNYEKGQMFSPVDPKNPPFKDFVLIKDSTKIRVGVTRGRPGRGQLGELTPGYDPNDWIVEFLSDKDQTIRGINEVVSTEFVYSHGRVHEELQRNIKKHNPKVIGVYDHGFALQPYARVLSLQGITRMTEAQPPTPTVPDSGLSDGPSDPGATTARTIQITDSPYGMLPDKLADLRVLSRPLDKMHLKMTMFEYKYQDPSRTKPQIRYRIFWGTLNRTTNGPNNRELFFSIDTPFSFLYKTLRDYANHLVATEHAIPLKEFYARHLVRSLFRLPSVPEPLKQGDTPTWEHVLTPQRMKRLVAAIDAKDARTRARRLITVLKELSKELESYSAFAESEGFKSALELIKLFFNKCTAERQEPKELWLAFHFIATAHTDAISGDSVRVMTDRFFARELQPRQVLMKHLGTLVVDHTKLSNALLRSGFIPSSVVSSARDTRTYLHPLAEGGQHSEVVRDLVTHALLSPDAKQLLATLKKAVPGRKHTYLAQLVNIYQKLPKAAQSPQLLYELMVIFDDPQTLVTAKKLTARLEALGTEYKVPDAKQRELDRVFASFRQDTQKAKWTFPHFHCGAPAA